MKSKIMVLLLLILILTLQLFNLKNGDNFINNSSNNSIQIIKKNINLETNANKKIIDNKLEIEKSKNLIINKENYIDLRAKLVLDIFGSTEMARNAASVVGIDKFGEFYFYRLSTGARFFDRNSEYLLIFHAGHNQDALDNDSGGYLIRYALSKNIDVLALNMPIGDHARYSRFKYPLSEFITPVLKSVNYVLNENKYKFINMSGISGGGVDYSNLLCN